MKHIIFAAILVCLTSAAAGASPAQDNALCKAVGHGAPAAIKALVKSGANPNARCGYQGTPLIDATDADNLPGMTALLDAGADIDGWSGGDACCRETALGRLRSVNAAQLLIAHHANVNIRRPGDGYTPLIWVGTGVAMASDDDSAADDAKIAQVLIEAGADVNVAGTDGMTALLMAISAHSKPFVTLLLDHGVNVNAKNEFGVSPLQVTINMANNPLTDAEDKKPLQDLEDFLRAHGAV